jgi:hypothetical protein
MNGEPTLLQFIGLPLLYDKLTAICDVHFACLQGGSIKTELLIHLKKFCFHWPAVFINHNYMSFHFKAQEPVAVICLELLRKTSPSALWVTVAAYFPNPNYCLR